MFCQALVNTTMQRHKPISRFTLFTPTAENFRRSRIFMNFSRTFPTKPTPGWLGKYILKKSKM